VTRKNVQKNGGRLASVFIRHSLGAPYFLAADLIIAATALDDHRKARVPVLNPWLDT
jgi:hypothetical protein